jgi:hypothetical protein
MPLPQGYKHSKKTRARMSIAARNRPPRPPISSKTRAKMSIAARNHPPFSLETRAKLSAVNTKHGHISKHRPSRTYKSWQQMKQRCLNPSNPRYDDYGGRGVTVAKRWMKFENFLADMGECPAGLSLDRKKNDKGYYKRNCHWATPSQQVKNRRSFSAEARVNMSIAARRAAAARRQSENRV